MWLVAFGYLTILYLMVRPGSGGPEMILEISTGIGNMIRAATGQPLKAMPAGS
jgi:hypothetical protein